MIVKQHFKMLGQFLVKFFILKFSLLYLSMRQFSKENNEFMFFFFVLNVSFVLL